MAALWEGKCNISLLTDGTKYHNQKETCKNVEFKKGATVIGKEK